MFHVKLHSGREMELATICMLSIVSEPLAYIPQIDRLQPTELGLVSRP